MRKIVTFENNPLTLVGRNIKVNQKAPRFTATTNDLKDIDLSFFNNKIKLVSFFVSLDTPVCDIQVRELNKLGMDLSNDTAIVGISKDLPFAHKRFKETFNIKNVLLISDFKHTSFGINYGVLIKEWNLLARGVMILDRKNTVRYIEITGELTNQPDYEEMLNQLHYVIKKPEMKSSEEDSHACIPSKGDVLPLSIKDIRKMTAQHPEWEMVDDKKLVRQFKFNTFVDAKYFCNLISLIAEEQGHHPSFLLNYNRLKVTLTTHAAGGLTENDFIMAKIIDELME
jgi:thiol peroxidase